MLITNPLICYRLLLHGLMLSMLLLPASVQGYDRPDAAARTDTRTPSHTARLQYLIDAAVRAGLPGVSLRVDGPGIDFTGAAGVAELNIGEPLTTNHVFYAASLGKTFTAAIALQLCDEGRLDLDASISTWLPASTVARIPSAEAITLRQLLNHTSGIIDYMNDQKVWRTAFVRDPNRRWTHSDIIPYIYDVALLFEPGSDYHYSNSNYILVGLIVEQVTGQPLHTLIRNRILVPLGLRNTFIGGEAVGSETQVHGYIRRHGRIIDTYLWYSHYGLADSGIYSTPAELAVFIRSLFTSGDILSESMRGAMTQASKQGHPPSDYGIGIYVQQNPWGAGHRWYAHDGIDPGYQADMMYLPELDLTIVIAANASLGKANRIYERLITAVIRVALDSVR